MVDHQFDEAEVDQQEAVAGSPGDKLVAPSLLPYAPELMRRSDLVKLGVLPGLYAAGRLAWIGFLNLAEPGRLEIYSTEGKAVTLALSFGGALALLWGCTRIASRPGAVGAAGFILLAAGCFFAFDLGTFLHGAGRWWLTASVFLTLAAVESALAANKCAAAESQRAISRRRRKFGHVPVFIGTVAVISVGLASYYLRTPEFSRLPTVAEAGEPVSKAEEPVTAIAPEAAAPEASGPSVITIRQAPKELTDNLFEFVYGAPPPTTTLIDDSTYSVRPAFAVATADRQLALVSIAEIPEEEASRVQSARIAVHYFEAGEKELAAIGAWPDLVQSGSLGRTGEPKLRDDLLPFPVITVEGSYTTMGCVISHTDLIVLTPAKPVTISFPSSYEYNGNSIKSRLQRIDDETLAVFYSGSTKGVLRLKLQGDHFYKSGGPSDDDFYC